MDEKENVTAQNDVAEPASKPDEQDEKRGKSKADKQKKAKKDKTADKSRLNGPDEPFFKNKRNVIRLVLFAVAVIIAVTAIATGVYQATNKEPGYYTIDLTLDDSMPYYSNGVTFYYYFTGNSSEIKADMRALTDIYTSVMKRSFKILDSKNEYTDAISIAAINRSLGKEVKISDELFDILSDAYKKTLDLSGYNMFAGMLYGFWDELIYNFDPIESDPLNSAEQDELYQRIYALTNDPDSFELKLDKDSKTAKLTVSQEVSRLIDDYGLELPILDLNLLYDAYRYDIVVAELAAKGYTNGYLYTDDGLTVDLSGHSGKMQYIFYEIYEGTPYMAAFVDGDPGSKAVMFRSFAFGGDDIGFYTLDNGGETIYRHKFQPSIEDPGLVLSVMAVSDTLSLADTAALNICVYSCVTKDGVKEFVGGHTDDAMFFVSFADEPAVVYTNHREKTSVFEEYVTVKEF